MANKSTSATTELLSATMKIISAMLFMPAVALAVQTDCVMQDKSVVRTDIKIEERSTIRREVVPDSQNQKKCMVDFRVRVGATWHTAFGEYVWDGHMPVSHACAVAVSRAEDDVRQRIGKSQSIGERTLICKDQPKLNLLDKTQIGTVGEVGQFRPHPEFRDRFYHNGTQCKWFVDTKFVKNDVRTFQGIVCQLEHDKWVVVDKF